MMAGKMKLQTGNLQAHASNFKLKHSLHLPNSNHNMQTAPKKVINAWAMYDWANSAYNLVITSTIFPAYWETITGDGNELTPDKVSFLGREFNNTSLYNYALSIAFLIVAV